MNFVYSRSRSKEAISRAVQTFRGVYRLESTSVAPKQRLKARAKVQKRQSFSDYKVTVVSGGNGGPGGLSFLSLPRKEFAGPDGGDGGNGGHVIFVADSNTKDLVHLTGLLIAKDGDKGRNKVQHGKCAEHYYVKVPRGTTIRDEEGTVLCDLSEEGQMYLAARGGAGGRGNYHFLSNEERAPAYAEEGGVGEKRRLQIELKIMAHAGLVGYPNAGKSTLLQAISRARPKVAAYPFTTLHPSIGMVEYEDSLQVAVADIPGLVPGAHKNFGLGIAFLRHIERCLCLLYVIDLSVQEPWQQLESLKYELEQYQPGLSTRPHAVVANKLDLKGSDERLKLLEEKLDLPVLGLSAKHGKGIHELMVHLRVLYDKHRYER